MTAVQLLVVAKEPVPGRVKTRLCPPCTAQQAAAVATAALVDTLAAASAAPFCGRTLLLSGAWAAPPGWATVAQRGADLGQRLTNGYADTARPGIATLLIGMDTPQVTVADLVWCAASLATADTVLAPAVDGGWWALGLRDPGMARVLAGVPMSTAETGGPHDRRVARGAAERHPPAGTDVA